MNSSERLMRYLDGIGIKYMAAGPEPIRLIKIHNDNGVEVFSSYQNMSDDNIDVRDDAGFLQIEDCCLNNGAKVGVSLTAEQALWYIQRWYFGKVPTCENHKLVKYGSDCYICRICKTKFYKE